VDPAARGRTSGAGQPQSCVSAASIVPALPADLACPAPRCQAAAWQGREVSPTGVVAVCSQNPAAREQASRTARSFVAPRVQRSRSCGQRVLAPTRSRQGELPQVAAAAGTFVSAEGHALPRVTEELLASPGRSFTAGPRERCAWSPGIREVLSIPSPPRHPGPPGRGH